MRACWLKWVGRDWSISADYIWLNYSGANRALRCSVFGGLLAGKSWRASRVLDGVYPGGAFGASRLMTVAAAVPFWITAVLLWVKYERCVNESVDGGVFR